MPKFKPKLEPKWPRMVVVVVAVAVVVVRWEWACHMINDVPNDVKPETQHRQGSETFLFRAIQMQLPQNKLTRKA